MQALFSTTASKISREFDCPITHNPSWKTTTRAAINSLPSTPHTKTQQIQTRKTPPQCKSSSCSTTTWSRTATKPKPPFYSNPSLGIDPASTPSTTEKITPTHQNPPPFPPPWWPIPPKKKNPQLNSNSTSAELFKAGETLTADVESGVSVGSGEYFIDAFIGTPPRHFQLIVDTGSDLNWVQCLPCEDCYPQEGPLFNSSLSSSYRPVPCSAEECSLVDTGAAGETCTNSTPSAPCKYFYWYGDRSNTTGELAFETFTVNVSGAAKTLPVGDVIFGCGHANRGLFHGPAGLLGLGRGQLSFASQLRRHHGHKFSYCLVDRNSNLSVTSKLVFGEDRRLSAHPDFQTTAFLSDGGTFFFLNVSSATVGGELLDIPSAVRDVSAGGIIIDSGTTLTYLAQPVYGTVKAAFESKIPYARGDFSPLELCYNVSGVGEVKLPEFSFRFGDGAVWKFPAENYFIQPDPEESVVCLAVLATPAGSLSILGNYQQQNFHVMYDVDGSRLGFAPMACADV